MPAPLQLDTAGSDTTHSKPSTCLRVYAKLLRATSTASLLTILLGWSTGPSPQRMSSDDEDDRRHDERFSRDEQYPRDRMAIDEVRTCCVL